VLEQHGIKPCLVNPRNMKNVPGKRTDFHECQWIQHLHSMGLLHSAFRPDGEVCAVCSLIAAPERSGGDGQPACATHMHKALTQMNVQIQNVISDITGLTGLTILEAIVAGERDPAVRARLREWVARERILVMNSTASVHIIHETRTESRCDSYLDCDELLESLQGDGEGRNEFEGIVGKSHALCGVLDQIRTVAPTDSTVLIEGETGTGKELIANAIHAQSNRRNRPLVKLNCSAIPLGLLESELFGHEKGAFTGAVMQKLGRFEVANGGTLFLDEIGDIPLELQPKLLRVLQEQEFERLGSTHTRRVDVRIVAATNQDLAGLVAEKQFRMDLYYRLNIFPVAIPPLRWRVEDIPMLVAHFVHKYARRMSRQISRIANDSLDTLMGYAWPGNVRELQNVIERAVILTNSDVLQLPPLQPCILSRRAALMTLAEAERDHILKALEDSNWVVGGKSGAAARLGLARTTLISKMLKRGLSRNMAQRRL
jgi:transcriptional regulator with GAF, ATPase, and Fis domain